MIKHHIKLWRVDKPIGSFLLLWPGLWALILAHPQHLLCQFSYRLLWTWIALLSVGGFFMRSAGCIINDILDRHLDQHVVRTKTRPLAAGALSVTEAFVSFCIALCGACSAWMWAPYDIKILSVCVLPLVIIYPLMKRFISCPQLFLGFVFNWSVLIGWMLVQPLRPPSFMLYASCIFWTLAYDTVYALQDTAGDIKMRVYSLAIKMGDKVKLFVVACAILSGSLSCLCSFLQGQQSLIILLLGIGWCYNVITIKYIDTSQPATCHRWFVRQGWFGGFVFILLLTGQHLTMFHLFS